MRFSPLLLTVALACWPALAQTVESIPFRATLSPRNEVPSLDLRASGTATVWLRVVKNAQGQVTGGTVEFLARYDFAGTPASVTGLHVHRGGAGVNGPIVLDSGLSTPVAGASGLLNLRAPLAPTVAQELLAAPGAFYVNLHTSANPAGAMRGQLIAADKLVFLTRVTPANVVPPVTGLGASGVAAVTLLGARDDQGRLQSAELLFALDYTGFPGDTRFTGLHIHAGNRQVRGPVTINATLDSPTPGAGGAGSLRYAAEIDLNEPGQFNTVTGLYQNPENFYADLHTAANTPGAIRGQLQRADAAPFTLNLSPRNEVPALDLDASAHAALTLHTLRAPDGTAVAGLAEFDVHPRFPGDVTFTGLHVHNGRAGVNGPVTIDSGVRAATGSLFPRAVIHTPVSVAALDSLLRNPELHYVNLHTTANPGGAVRAQVAAANSAGPAITNAISGVWDPTIRRLARGGLVTIFGRNLTKVSGTATGTEGGRAPLALNGSTVTVDGLAAPILQVTPGYVIAQVPNETPLGLQSVRVGDSNALSVPVEGAAPAIFFDAITPAGQHAAILKQNYSAVSAANPARPGEVLIFYGTGFGSTNVAPPVTGALPLGEAAPVPTVTVGGRTAEVLYSVFAPGLVGLNQVAIRMPPASTGNVNMTVSVTGVPANVVFFEAGAADTSSVNH